MSESVKSVISSMAFTLTSQCGRCSDGILEAGASTTAARRSRVGELHASHVNPSDNNFHAIYPRTFGTSILLEHAIAQIKVAHDIVGQHMERRTR